jgi:TPR repeat protein
VYWYQKAANQGQAKAQSNLGAAAFWYQYTACL